MKIYKVMVEIETFGQKILRFEQLIEDNNVFELNRIEFETDDDTHTVWYSFDNQKDADRMFINLFKFFLIVRSNDDFPKRLQFMANKIIKRAERSYPELLI